MSGKLTCSYSGRAAVSSVGGEAGDCGLTT